MDPLSRFPQGMVLGAFIQGFEVQGRAFTGHSFDFLTPFSLLTGLALMFGYGLLGAGWLILQDGRGIAGLGATAWPLVFYRGHRARSASSAYGHPSFTRTSRGDVLLAQSVAAVAHTRSSPPCSRGWNGARSMMIRKYCPFGRRRLFVLAYIGIAISLWPNIVPYQFSIWEAASSESTPGLPPGRNAISSTDNFHVLGMVPVGVPRKSTLRHRIPLSVIVANPTRHPTVVQSSSLNLWGLMRIRWFLMQDQARQ